MQLAAVDTPSEYASYEALPAAVVASGRLLTDGRAGDGPAREGDEEELRRHLRDALLQEMASEARAAAASLGRRLGAQRDPGAALERMARDATRALQRAARALARAHGSDARALALVEDACRDVAGNLPRLLPSLLDDVIGEAERSGDDDLGKRLRQLRDEMATMD